LNQTFVYASGSAASAAKASNHLQSDLIQGADLSAASTNLMSFRPSFTLELLRCFGSLGSKANGELHWPVGLAFSSTHAHPSQVPSPSSSNASVSVEDELFVADNMNHRICVFSSGGVLS
jgi:hypothetical protein